MLQKIAANLQSAIDFCAKRGKRIRLVRELSKLNPAAESRIAEEALGDESWPTC